MTTILKRTLGSEPPPEPLPHSKFIPENQRGWVYHAYHPPKQGKKRSKSVGGIPPSTSQDARKVISVPASPDLSVEPLPRHAENLVYTETYPWRPTEGGKYIHPSHRNPTVKQAFYDTHFGSSSNYRGLLTGPAVSSSVITRKASKLLGGGKDHLSPLQGGVQLAAQQSGFDYGLSLEDAVKVDAIVSEKTSRWKETLNGSWSFLPSFRSATIDPELIPTVKKDPGNPNYFKRLSGNIVIMGGYRGSVLRDAKTHEMMWIPIKVGVGLRRPTLEIGLSQQDEERSEDLVYSSDMVANIGRLVDMGKRLKERCETSKSAKVYTWGYDWRLSLAISSKRLINYLQELYAESGRGAKIVTHSMGGLVALHALATCSNPRIFEGLIFASTPFMGTPNILGPFRFGDAALFNDTICSPRATFSFRSSFYLLPTDGRCFQDPQTEERRNVDFFDAKTWVEMGFSPCVQAKATEEEKYMADNSAAFPDVQMEKPEGGVMGLEADQEEQAKLQQSNREGGSTTPTSEAYEYLVRTLEQVRAFHADLAEGFDPARKVEYPPIMLFTSGRTPSVRGALLSAPGDYANMTYAPGDGVITRKSSTTLPSNWGDLLVSRTEIAPPGTATRQDRRQMTMDGHGILESSHRHVTLLSDVDGVGKCFELIRRANVYRRRG